ncbi:MAG: 3-methyl-2-oxobutanoate hydroxymethyltransferase [Syntrophales bacterium]
MSTQSRMDRVSVTTIRNMKEKGEKITMLTAYDYPTALALDQCGVEMLLVGDSLGMVVLGYDSTLPVTMEDMIHHTKAVSRGASSSMVISDLPFLSYHCSVDEAVWNAGRLMQEGAQGVKLEGGRENAETVRRICLAGIPVVAHLGLTPQSVHQLGGYRVQGKDQGAAERMIDDAKILEEAGAFAVVLECIPSSLGKAITESVSIPTIGIGAGPDCDGQVLVIHDILGLYERFTPKFVKQYSALNKSIRRSVKKFMQEVKEGSFPDENHSFR